MNDKINEVAKRAADVAKRKEAEFLELERAMRAEMERREGFAQFRYSEAVERESKRHAAAMASAAGIRDRALAKAAAWRDLSLKAARQEMAESAQFAAEMREIVDN